MEVPKSIIIIVILCIFLPVVVFGQPQLGSSIGSLVLSGEQCPGTLSLTCDARNFGFIDSINWFVGDERVAVFDYNVDSTPFTATTTRPDILNATVQLTTATFTGGQFSFINFTLSASVSNFLSLQGQNISCGNLAIRSLFGIKEFTINNESSSYQGMSYLAKYSGPEGRLMEVVLNWSENRASNCTNIISYFVNISYEVMSTRRNFTSEVCSSSQCSYEIDVTQNITSDVIVEFYADSNLISTTNIASTTGNNVSVDECSGEVSIRCSDLNTNENCTINYRQDGMDFNKTIPPSNISALPMGVQDFQVTINSRSTILQQTVNYILNDVGSEVAALVGVGVTLYVLGLTEHLVAVLVFLFCVYKKKQGVERCWKRLIPIFVIMATVMYFLIAIVWIVAFTAYTQYLCGTLKSAEIAIHIAAFVLSIMITLISTLILAVVLIVWPCKECNPEVAEYGLKKEEKCYDFTFGNGEKPDYKYKELSICSNCNEDVSTWAKTFEREFCDVCGEQMCTKCKNEIFLFRMMCFGRACKKCEVPYWEQQKQFAYSKDSIAEMSLLWREKCSEPCYKCNNESTKTDLTCDFCDKKICSRTHTRTIEEKEETKSSTNNEKRVDSEITSKSGQNGKQGNYQETSHSKTQRHCEENGQKISEVSTDDKGIRVLEKKEHQVCRMCYTVYKRKELYTKEETKKEEEETKKKKEEEETKKEEEETKKKKEETKKEEEETKKKKEETKKKKEETKKEEEETKKKKEETKKKKEETKKEEEETKKKKEETKEKKEETKKEEEETKKKKEEIKKEEEETKKKKEETKKEEEETKERGNGNKESGNNE